MTDIKKINLNGVDYNLGEGVPYAVKQAMDSMFAKLMYTDDISSDYATFQSWASSKTLVSITAVFTQGDNIIFDVDDLQILKQYLVVTATYDDSSTATVNGYSLSGTLEEGTSTVTVTYQGKTTTFTVDVTDGTDVTPNLENLVGLGSASKQTVVPISSNSVRIYATTASTYCGAQISIALEAGYTYRLSYNVNITRGNPRIIFRDSTTEKSLGGIAATENGYYSRDVVPSDSQNWSSSTSPSGLLTLFITYSASETGDVTFTNVKVIKYMAGE